MCKTKQEYYKSYNDDHSLLISGRDVMEIRYFSLIMSPTFQLWSSK